MSNKHKRSNSDAAPDYNASSGSRTACDAFWIRKHQEIACIGGVQLERVVDRCLVGRRHQLEILSTLTFEPQTTRMLWEATGGRFDVRQVRSVLRAFAIPSRGTRTGGGRGYYLPKQLLIADVVLTQPGPQVQEVVALLHEMFGPIYADDEQDSRASCERELGCPPVLVSTAVSGVEAEVQANRLRALGATVEVRRSNAS